MRVGLAVLIFNVIQKSNEEGKFMVKPQFNQTEAQEAAKAARAALKEISNAVKPLVKVGAFDSVNEAIVNTYKSEEHQEFKKFWEWKREGYTILKGSKAFPVWGQPVKRTAKTEAPKDEYEFFPICYLFSNSQVRRAENV